MTLRAARALAAVGLFLTLSSCDEKFGDELADFVNTRVAPLSEQFANADLRFRWQTAFNMTLVDTESTLDSLAKTLSQITPPTFDPGLSVEAGLDTMEKQAKLLAELSGYEGTVEDTIRSIDTATSACSSDKIYRYAKLSNSGLDSIAGIVLPDAEMSVYVSNDDSNTFFRNFTSWFGAVERRDQDRKAQDAIKSYPSKVISDQKLAALSTTLCQQELAAAAPRLSEQRAALVGAQQALQDFERALLESYRALEANVLPRSYDEILARSGAQKSLLDAAQPMVEAELRNRFRLITAQIGKFEQGLAQSTDCHGLVNGLSDYKDLLDEVDLQLEAIQSRQRVPAAESDYASLRVLITAKKQGFSQFSAKVTARGCNS